MNGRQERLTARFALGRDPLDEPLNASWDAVVRHEQPSASNVNPEDVAFLRRLHALELRSLPSSAFLDDLEQRLVDMASPVASGPSTTKVRLPRQIEHPRSVRRRSGSLLPSHRLFSMQGALAVLAVMIVASLFVLDQAVPKPSEPPAVPAATVSAPALETLMRFDFAPPMWNMPDATLWTHTEFGMFEVAPGASFTTDLGWHICGDGPLLLRVLSGELSVQPAGPALDYLAGQRNTPPVEVSAGSTVSMQQNDTLVYSAVDAASASNPGNEPMLAIYALVGSMQESSHDCGFHPHDVLILDLEYEDHMEPLSSTGAAVSLQHLELHPFDSFVFDADAFPQYLAVLDLSHLHGLRIYPGAVDPLLDPRSDYSLSLRTLGKGPHTLFNAGQGTIDLYFLVVEPYPQTAGATPAP